MKDLIYTGLNFNVQANLYPHRGTGGGGEGVGISPWVFAVYLLGYLNLFIILIDRPSCPALFKVSWSHVYNDAIQRQFSLYKSGHLEATIFWIFKKKNTYIDHL